MTLRLERGSSRPRSAGRPGRCQTRNELREAVRPRSGLRGVLALARGEAGVEGFVLGGHVAQLLGGLEAGAVFLFQALAQVDEALRPQHVDIAERAARERREAEAQD